MARGEQLTAAEEVNLARRAREGDLTARDLLVERNLGLVGMVVRESIPRDRAALDADDLFQEGVWGLMRAIPKFDPERGLRFSTYVTWWIRQAVFRAIQEQSRPIRLPAAAFHAAWRLNTTRSRLEARLGRDPEMPELAAASGVTPETLQAILATEMAPLSLDAPLKGQSALALADAVAARAQWEERLLDRLQVAELLPKLNRRERQVLALRFGLGDGMARSLTQVAELLGVSRERVRQIEHEALAKARECLGVPVTTERHGRRRPGANNGRTRTVGRRPGPQRVDAAGPAAGSGFRAE
jgi:RNA polymerase sigma factor (sigma-70 family)